MPPIICYSSVERMSLRPGAPNPVLDLRISPLKRAVAENYEEDEWDALYLKAYGMFSAMVELAQRVTTARRPWVWAANNVPLRYTTPDGEPQHLYPTATSPADDANISTILNKTLTTLESMVKSLDKAAEQEFGITELSLSLVDRKSSIWKLSWKVPSAPFGVENVIYTSVACKMVDSKTPATDPHRTGWRVRGERKAAHR